MRTSRLSLVSLAAALALSGANAASAATQTLIGGGRAPSLAIGGDGKGLVAYLNSGVKVTHCANVACTSSSTTSVGSGIGGPPALTIGADGLGLVAWVDGSELRTAHCMNAACTAKQISIHLSAAQVAYGPTGATTGGDGFGLVTFIDTATGSHRLLHCKNAACSSSDVTTVGSVGITEYWAPAAVTTSAAGKPLVAYYQEVQTAVSTPGLYVVACTTYTCNGRRSTQKISNGILPNGIDIIRGVDGLPLVLYSVFPTPTWKTAHCSTATCSSFTSSTLDDGALDFDSPSMALDSTGVPMIAYGRQGAVGSPALRLAHCQTSLCDQAMSFNLTGVPQLDELAVDPSLALGSDGKPLVAFPSDAQQLYVLHCTTPSCFIQPP